MRLLTDLCGTVVSVLRPRLFRRDERRRHDELYGGDRRPGRDGDGDAPRSCERDVGGTTDRRGTEPRASPRHRDNFAVAGSLCDDSRLRCDDSHVTVLGDKRSRTRVAPSLEHTSCHQSVLRALVQRLRGHVRV